MKRTTTWALLSLACLLAVPSIAQARYADGMNLYEYVGSNPAAYRDPTGMWKGGDHRSLTRESLDDMSPGKLPAQARECKTHVVDTLVAANLGQDDGAAFNDLARHYNRHPNDTVAQANAAYTTYLGREIKDFETLLGKVKGKCDSKEEQKACDDALAALGRLSHSWQDYFAHAVLLNGEAGPAWAANPQIKGTPDNLNAQLKASSWRLPFGGEHGWSEPADRDKPGGRQLRYNDARAGTVT